jgi:hypothetical protein
MYRILLVAFAATFFAAAAPAWAQPKGDRYLCYEVARIGAGGAGAPDVKVRDQFGSDTASIGKPRFVCNPVDVDKKGILNKALHITCYETTTPIRPKNVLITNEFERKQPAGIELAKAQLICVPSGKKIQP